MARILYLSRWFPDPPDHGAKLRAWHNLHALAEAGYEITLLSYSQAGQSTVAGEELRRLCGRIETFTRRPFQPDGWRARGGVFSSSPRSMVDTFSPQLRDAVEREVRGGGYAIGVVGTIDMTAYTPWLGSLPLLLDELELGHFTQHSAASSVVQRARIWLT